jgi:capsular polysaccharide transport system permease protein
MFYTAQTAPPMALPYLWYNPLFHSTELMREYYYYDYTSPIFDPYYYYGWALTSLAVGLALERLLRHRLLAAAN